jgi:hypothetical protein
VQSAINSASPGDTVLIPGGTCTWSSQVTIPGNVGITLSSQASTTIIWASGGSLNVTANASTSTFVSGITFDGAFVNGGCPIVFNTSFSPQSATFRFNNNTLNYMGGGPAGTMLCINGNGPGLLDHNTFTTDAGASELIHNYGEGPGNSTSWAEGVAPGGPDAIYLENNTFTYQATGNFYGTSAIQNYFGSRVVFRYNTLEMMQVDVHGDHPGTCGTVNGRWWEIYENTFHTTAANANQSNFVVLRGGSGVVFNNHHPASESNQGTGNIYLTNDCGQGSYPIPDQVGEGINQNMSPAYIWGNDSNIPVGSGSSYVVLGQNYFVSSSQPSNITRCQSGADTSSGCPVSYSYTPYVYPHPLDTNGPPQVPAPPTNLIAVIN